MHKLIPNISSFGLRLLLIACITSVALWLSFTLLLVPRDFSIYLSGAQSFLNQHSAWDAVQLNATAHAYSYLPLYFDGAGLWTPPTFIPILAPFTMFSFSVAAWLWIFTNVILAWCEIRLLGEWLPTTSERTRVLALLLYPPMFALLLYGQVSGLVLLGYILFVYCAKRGADGWAGLSLILTTLKPHLGFLAWIFIAWWIISQRHWKTVLGFVGGLAPVLAFLFLVNPRWLADYQIAISSLPLSYDASTLLRVVYRLFFPDSPWIQFVGVYASVVILLIALGLRRRPIGLLPAIPLLLAFSVVLAPYGWIYDQIVAWPAFLWVLTNLLTRHPKWWGWLWVLIANIAYYLQIWHNWGDNNPLIFWLPFLVIILWSGQLILQRDVSQSANDSLRATQSASNTL